MAKASMGYLRTRSSTLCDPQTPTLRDSMYNVFERWDASGVAVTYQARSWKTIITNASCLSVVMCMRCTGSEERRACYTGVAACDKVAHSQVSMLSWPANISLTVERPQPRHPLTFVSHTSSKARRCCDGGEAREDDACFDAEQ